jgi:hypothetical protein
VNWVYPASTNNIGISFLSIDSLSLYGGGNPIISSRDQFLPVLAITSLTPDEVESKATFHTNQPPYKISQSLQIRTDLFTIIWTEFDLRQLMEDRNVQQILKDGKSIDAYVNISLKKKDGPWTGSGQRYDIVY